MRRSTYGFRRCVSTLVCLGAAWSAPVRGQSTAPLVSDPGSTVGVTLGFVAEVPPYGTFGDVDSDGAEANGTSLLTLFPTDPPFTHAILHSIHMNIDQLEFEYRVLAVIRLYVTLSDLAFDSTGPANGGIDAAGHAVFPALPLRVSGMAHVVCETLGIDAYMEIDDSMVAPFQAVISEDAGDVILDGIVIPPFHGEFGPAELPPGVDSLVIDVTTDAGDVRLRGPYDAAVLGDGDADGDVDLVDYSALHACLDGPNMPVDVFCTLFDFDGDGDVDLADYAEFQRAFAKER